MVLNIDTFKTTYLLKNDIMHQKKQNFLNVGCAEHLMTNYDLCQ